MKAGTTGFGEGGLKCVCFCQHMVLKYFPYVNSIMNSELLARLGMIVLGLLLIASPAFSPCDPDYVCWIECEDDSDCGAGEYCYTGSDPARSMSCVSDGSSSGGGDDDDDDDGYVSDDECRSDDECGENEECDYVDGVHICVPAEGYCESDSDCEDGEECSDGECVDIEGWCGSALDCEPWEACEDNRCEMGDGRCADDSDCESYEVCGSGYRCENAPNYCDTPGDCSPWEECSGHLCGLGEGKCASDTQCEEGEACNQNLYLCEVVPELVVEPEPFAPEPVPLEEQCEPLIEQELEKHTAAVPVKEPEQGQWDWLLLLIGAIVLFALGFGVGKRSVPQASEEDIEG